VGDDFFDESTEQSRIKAEIVTKYFDGWSSIILPQVLKRPGGRLQYLDLFCGPGRYKDGTESTPLLILRRAIAKPGLREHLVTVFNDANPRHAEALRTEVRVLPGAETLVHQPRILNREVDRNVVDQLGSAKLAPTLLFADPWGYKGLSQGLFRAVVKDWGCDCVFFFNYNRVNAALDNPRVQTHMAALFGEEELAALKAHMATLDGSLREDATVEALRRALRSSGMQHIVTFAFHTEAGRTSHYLVLVSKHPKARELMKSIMARYSSSLPQGVPSFRYNPDERRSPTLPGLRTPLDDLMDSLCSELAGRTLTVQEVSDLHSQAERVERRIYKQALLALEENGRIRCAPPAGERRKGTMADGVTVTFPAKETPDG